MRKFFVCVCFLLPGYATLAQLGLKAGVSVFPERKLLDSSGTFAMQRLHINLSYPLLKKFRKKEGALLPSFQVLSASLGLAANRVDYSLLGKKLNNLNLMPGLSYLHYNGYKSTYLLHGSPFISTAADALDQGRLNWLGLGTYLRRVNSTWSYHLGLLYLNARNKELILPVAGFNYRMDNKNSIQFNFPFNLAYKFKIDLKKQIRLGIGLNGFVSQVDMQNNPDVLLRLRQSVLQLNYQERINRSFSWQVGGGILGKRKISLYSLPSGDIHSEIKPGLFIQASVIYRPGKKQQGLSAAQDVSDTDLMNLNDYELDELEEELEGDDQ